jgi:hypothetical protein
MDLAGDLEIFTLVAETGSFSAAGHRLSLAPSCIARVMESVKKSGVKPPGTPL